MQSHGLWQKQVTHGTDSSRSSHTRHLNRGTPVFLTSEAFLAQPESGISLAISDLKKVDIWANGMVSFNVINPDLRHPYQKDFELAAGAITPMAKLNEILRVEKKPSFSGKYKHLQATDWLPLKGVYHDCTAWDPRRRPTASEIVSNLE